MKTKKELEDDKKRAETEAAAHAYVEFMATFDDNAAPKDKVWVKAGTFDAGSRREDHKDKGKLYKPTSKLAELAEKFSSAEKAQQVKPPSSSDRPERPGKKKEKEKKKSNLEIFKEELKAIQEERAERNRIKNQCQRDSGKSSRFDPPEEKLPSYMTSDDLLGPGSYDAGDPATTNLYLGNLSPKITEQRLMELFGRFGPLASIKIMWPRTDNEKNRGRNCGFVAYMNRKDGERALANLNGKDIDTFEMKLGWGKAVPIPLQPIYIPPSLRELTLPPPPSGLPFNAQPDQRDQIRVRSLGQNILQSTELKDQTAAQRTLAEEEKRIMDEILQQAVVKVVVPTERSLLQLIHRTIEFVVREGPMFEAMIMNRELNNPCYRFLFENQGPAHVYYRWKLFSILHGDSTSRWSTQPFRMFDGGSIWKPPPVNPFLQGMPEELIQQDREEEERNRRGSLSTAQRGRLEHMIRTLTAERSSVGEAMVWCIEHADAAREICQCLTEALCNDLTPIPKKIARLYLVSDILHNCTVKVSNASFYRKGLHDKLQEIFEGLHSAHAAIPSRLKAEGLKQRVLACCRVWEEWAVYPPDFLLSLQNIFLGLVKRGELNGAPTEEAAKEDVDGIPLEDVDGAPLGDIDGLPLGPKAPHNPLLASSAAISALMGYSDDEDEDLDGAPLVEPSPPRQAPKPTPGTGGGFVAPKWESVSPGRVEAQAMTLSKWDTLEPAPANGGDSRDSTPVYDRSSPSPPPPAPPAPPLDDIDGVPIMYADYKRKKRSAGSSSDEAEEPPTPRGSRGEEEDTRRTLERLSEGCSEARRARLREVEVRVVQYGDELERRVRPLKPGYTVERQVAHYRHKLLRKIEKEEAASPLPPSSAKRRRSRSPDSERSERRRERRSRSPHKSRRRSRSPRKRRSRSRSPPRKHKKKRH